VAALCAGAATYATISALAPPPPPTVTVAVAARDLPAGVLLDDDDVRLARMPEALVPREALGAARPTVGRTVAAPMRAGEVFTDRRLVSGSLLAGYGGGLLAVPVRVGDRGAVELLRVGDRINVYAAARADQRSAHLVVADVPVVARPDERTDTTVAGALVVLAVSQPEAADLAQASATSVLSVAVRQ
jgi:Flp pilus assembly protein CpaB